MLRRLWRRATEGGSTASQVLRRCECCDVLSVCRLIWTHGSATTAAAAAGTDTPGSCHFSSAASPEAVGRHEDHATHHDTKNWDPARGHSHHVHGQQPMLASLSSGAKLRQPTSSPGDVARAAAALTDALASHGVSAVPRAARSEALTSAVTLLESAAASSRSNSAAAAPGRGTLSGVLASRALCQLADALCQPQHLEALPAAQLCRLVWAMGRGRLGSQGAWRRVGRHMADSPDALGRGPGDHGPSLSEWAALLEGLVGAPPDIQQACSHQMASALSAALARQQLAAGSQAGVVWPPPPDALAPLVVATARLQAAMPAALLQAMQSHLLASRSSWRAEDVPTLAAALLAVAQPRAGVRPALLAPLATELLHHAASCVIRLPTAAIVQLLRMTRAAQREVADMTGDVTDDWNAAAARFGRLAAVQLRSEVQDMRLHQLAAALDGLAACGSALDGVLLAAAEDAAVQAASSSPVGRRSGAALQGLGDRLRVLQVLQANGRRAGRLLRACVLPLLTAPAPLQRAVLAGLPPPSLADAALACAELGAARASPLPLGAKIAETANHHHTDVSRLFSAVVDQLVASMAAEDSKAPLGGISAGRLAALLRAQGSLGTLPSPLAPLVATHVLHHAAQLTGGQLAELVSALAAAGAAFDRQQLGQAVVCWARGPHAQAGLSLPAASSLVQALASSEGNAANGEPAPSHAAALAAVCSAVLPALAVPQARLRGGRGGAVPCDFHDGGTDNITDLARAAREAEELTAQRDSETAPWSKREAGLLAGLLANLASVPGFTHGPLVTAAAQLLAGPDVIDMLEPDVVVSAAAHLARLSTPGGGGSGCAAALLHLGQGLVRGANWSRVPCETLVELLEAWRVAGLLTSGLRAHVSRHLAVGAASMPSELVVRCADVALVGAQSQDGEEVALWSEERRPFDRQHDARLFASLAARLLRAEPRPPTAQLLRLVVLGLDVGHHHGRLVQETANRWLDVLGNGSGTSPTAGPHAPGAQARLEAACGDLAALAAAWGFTAVGTAPDAQALTTRLASAGVTLATALPAGARVDTARHLLRAAWCLSAAAGHVMGAPGWGLHIPPPASAAVAALAAAAAPHWAAAYDRLDPHERARLAQTAVMARLGAAPGASDPTAIITTAADADATTGRGITLADAYALLGPCWLRELNRVAAESVDGMTTSAAEQGAAAWSLYAAAAWGTLPWDASEAGLLWSTVRGLHGAWANQLGDTSLSAAASTPRARRKRKSRHGPDALDAHAARTLAVLGPVCSAVAAWLNQRSAAAAVPADVAATLEAWPSAAVQLVPETREAGLLQGLAQGCTELSVAGLQGSAPETATNADTAGLPLRVRQQCVEVARQAANRLKHLTRLERQEVRAKRDLAARGFGPAWWWV